MCIGYAANLSLILPLQPRRPLHKFSLSLIPIIFAMTDSKVPQPGPAKLKRNAGPDEWLEAAKDCKYLSESHMKQLCEIVKEYMMEGAFCAS